MRSVATILFFFLMFLQVGAQVYHSCPLIDPATKGYENPLNEKWLSAYDVKYYDLHLSVSNTSTEIAGSATILLELVRETDTVVLELQDALDVTKIGLSENINSPTFVDLEEFQHTGDAIYIPLGMVRNMGEKIFLKVEYEGVAGQGRGFFAGITSAKDPTYGFDVTYSLSEPHNASDWFPVKQVLEDKIDSVLIKLQCDDHLMAASNGLLEKIVPGGENTLIYQWRTTYPMAYYLLSFAVADYRDFSFNAALSADGDSVKVQNYIYDSDLVYSDWVDEIRATGSMISTFSELLMDYPFSKEKYGHAMAPLGGGMEHQTMTTIHNFSFFLVAHELAHQWFGDYITCGNWQDIWINEGFASYMEYVAAQQLLGQQAADAWMINAMSIAKSETGGSVYVPEESVEDTYRLFDYGLSYKKGAILLHMIRYHLDDDELFFGVLTTYLEQFGFGLAVGEDFKEILEIESGMDFSCFFDQWYYGEGYPRFILQWYQEGDSLKISSEQVSTAPEKTPFFKTPFDLEIRLSNGSIIEKRLLQDEQEEAYSLFMDGQVEEVLFDPHLWLMKSSNVIKQIQPGRKFVYWPNPVADNLFVQFPSTSTVEEIIITNMNGQELIRHNGNENPVVMNLKTLADGPYLLVIHDADRTYLERIVVISND